MKRKEKSGKNDDGEKKGREKDNGEKGKLGKK